MRAFRDFSIGRKLTLITMLISGAAMLLACGAFAIYEQIAFRDALARDFRLLADMFDDNVAAEVAFHDIPALQQTLGSLSADSRIMAAAVYDHDGVVIAHYERPGVGNFTFPAAKATSQDFGDEWLETFQTIELAGERIGEVYICTGLTELRVRVWRYCIGVAGVLIGCLVVALVLASRLQLIISQPISELAHTAATIATGKNYGVRAVKQSGDEIGVLIDAFNAMLAQIESHEAGLQRANDELEQRVAERTRALQQEIAERRHSEQALQESNQRFEMVTRATADVIWDRDMQSNAVWRNENCERLFGYRAGEIEASPAGWAAHVHPEDLGSAMASLEATLHNDAPVWAAEYRFRRRDGTYAHILDRGYVLRDAAGRVVRMIGAMQDITALKAAQETAAREHAKFKFIFDAVPVGISLFEPGVPASRLVNPAHVRITGVSAEASRQRDAFVPVSDPREYAAQQALAARFVAGEINEFTFKKRYFHPDGSVTWAILSSRMFIEPISGKKQAVTSLVDITEREQAESELAQTHQRLIETSRQAGMAEVATGVLHNVGNVLNSVNVSATLIAEHVRDSKTGRLEQVAALLAEHATDLPAFLTRDPRGRQLPGYLQALAQHVASEETGTLREIEALRHNIEHIREIVTVQQGFAKFSAELETVGLADMVETAIGMLASALTKNGVTVVRDFRARPILAIEKHKVLQILVNLIRNAKLACKESGRPDRQIMVRLEEQPEKVLIAVIDNGVGIAPENLTRIFGHGFTTRKDGHGFGLHSGANIAKTLGGELTAHSAGPGRGATFILQLPRLSIAPAT